MQETCDWDGTMNHELSSDSEYCATDAEFCESDWDDDVEVEELQGEELYQNENCQLE